jgi:hypothetical protein
MVIGVGGRPPDHLRRREWFIGVGTLTVLSVGGAFAPAMGPLIVSRAVMGFR